jgi:hypothetical protein
VVVVVVAGRRSGLGGKWIPCSIHPPKLLAWRRGIWVDPSAVVESAVIRAHGRATCYQERGRHKQKQKTHSRSEHGCAFWYGVHFR